MTTHTCGGTIATHQSPDPAAEPRDYRYCDRCGAFSYEEGDLPEGTDRAANKEAWDDGEDCSPDAEVRS